MTLLMTGATGFVGHRTLELLAENFDKIFVLVRPQSRERTQEYWKGHKNIELVTGDLVVPGVLQELAEGGRRFTQVSDVLHMGALYDLQGNSADSYLSNVVGTQNILDLASQLPGLQRFHHVSTIAISGTFQGHLKETMFNVGQRFTNSYAHTKFRAEGLIGSWKAENVKRLIYRLGVVVGDSQNGYISKTDGPYYFFHSLRANRALWKNLTRFTKLPFPFSTEAQLPMIPVDIAARQIARMVSNPNPTPGRLRTYHLAGAQVSVPELLTRSLHEFGMPATLLAVPRILVPERVVAKLGIPAALLDYMYSKCHYETDHVLEDFPQIKALSFDDFAGPMYAWAKEHA